MIPTLFPYLHDRSTHPAGILLLVTSRATKLTATSQNDLVGVLLLVTSRATKLTATSQNDLAGVLLLVASRATKLTATLWGKRRDKQGLSLSRSFPQVVPRPQSCNG